MPRRLIYVDDDAEIDLSYCARTPTPSDCRDPRSGPADCNDFSLAIPANTTLASGRGASARTARCSRARSPDCPLLDVQGPGVRITGLRTTAPTRPSRTTTRFTVTSKRWGSASFAGDKPSRWNTEIDNNELSAWPQAGVKIENVQGVHIHHNVIHFNRRNERNNTCDHNYDLGYGVVVGPGSATIEANVFDHDSHDIASDGKPGAHYTATYNLVLGSSVGHSFDVHGGGDRHDCTNIAGSAFVIHHNTFLQSHKPAVRCAASR